MKQVLLIFSKNLVYGNVKTRIAATAGNDVAFAIYKQLLEYTASITNHLPIKKMVFYSERIEEQDMWSDDIYEKRIQTGAELGERMCNAFVEVFKNGYDKAVIIGTDCFELSSGIIMNAFDCLNNYDIVIGPAKDGGYYLLGMRNLQTELFKNINWSSDKVLQQTLAVCDRLSLTTQLLPELSDIDYENDLKTINGQSLLK
jgi:uncharacterized protein